MAGLVRASGGLRQLMGRGLRLRGAAPPPEPVGPQPPNGFLFNEKPLAAGEGRVRESWETVYTIGMGGCILFAIVGYATREDTTAKTWATKDAEERVKATGL